MHPPPQIPQQVLIIKGNQMRSLQCTQDYQLGKDLEEVNGKIESKKSIYMAQISHRNPQINTQTIRLVISTKTEIRP